MISFLSVFPLVFFHPATVFTLFLKAAWVARSAVRRKKLSLYRARSRIWQLSKRLWFEEKKLNWLQVTDVLTTLAQPSHPSVSKEKRDRVSAIEQPIKPFRNNQANFKGSWKKKHHCQ